MGTVLLVRHGETSWNREGRVQGWAPTSLTDRGREQARALAVALGEPITGAGATSWSTSGERATAAPVRSAAGEGTVADDRAVDVDDSAVADEERPITDSEGSTPDRAPLNDGAVDRIVTSDLRRARETAAAVERTTGCRATSEPGWRERNMGRLQGLPAPELFERNPQLSLKFSGDAAARRAPEGGETLLETRERVLDAWDRLRADLGVGETVLVVSHSGPISLLLGHLRNVPIRDAVLERSQRNGAINEIRVEAGVADSTDDAANSTDDAANSTDDAANSTDEGDRIDGDDAPTGVVRENWTAYLDRDGGD